MKRIVYISLSALMLILAASCKKDEPEKMKVGEDGVTPLPEAIDIGLSVKWASFNLAARNEFQFGLYYAWGETSFRIPYTFDNYQYTSQEKAQLPSSRDAASELLGEGWRMPTKDEVQELVDTFNDEDYTWKMDKKTADNGNEILLGWRVTCNAGKAKGNSIYLPAAGLYSTVLGYDGNQGFYWSSTMYDEWKYNAWQLGITAEGPILRHDGGRYLGCTIRPVYED